MTYEIPDGSPWKAAAVKFGAELRRALEARRVGWRQLSEAMGKDVHSSVDRYKAGRTLPRIGQAQMLSEALAWPELLELVRDARTFICPVDGRTFVCDTGHRGIYCSNRCQSVMASRRAREHSLAAQEARGYVTEDPERVLVARLKQELTRVRHGTSALSRKEIRSAIRQWESTSSQSRHRRTRNQLNDHLAAVEAMCAACEPEGICRTADCPLRSVSPLPYIPTVDVALAAPKPANAGWSDPETAAARRGRQGERMRRWWEAMTPAERASHVARSKASRKTPAGYRSCGCPARRHLDVCPLRRAKVPA